MNIYDISRKAGVSTATVSRVINGSSNVSEKTRQVVLAAIEESGYTPNAFARGLGLNTMQTVGILCADCSDPYLARAVYYIEQNLRRGGYDSLLMCTGFELDSKQSCLNLLMSKRVDGIIFVGSNYVEHIDSANDYIRAAAVSIPVMLVNGSLSAQGVYSTLCDDFAALSELTERFLRSGRRNLVYIYNSDSYSGRKKLEGFRSTLDRNAVPPDDRRICRIASSDASAINEAYAAIERLVRSGVEIDGVIASEDIIAIGALKYARDNGLRIPEDLFAAGFNNSDIALCCEPELTTVDNRLELLCRHSVSALMAVLSGDTAVPEKAVFSGEIVERKTTAFV